MVSTSILQGGGSQPQSPQTRKFPAVLRVIVGCYTRDNQSSATTIKQIEARDAAVNNLDRTI